MRVISDSTKRALSTSWPQVLFFAVIGALLGLHMGALTRALYPLGALAVGLYLLRFSAAGYVSFCFWLWFFSPFVRRVADFYAEWQDPSIVLLTPYLVSGLVALKLVGRLLQRQPQRIAGTPLLALAAGGILLGVPFGVMKAPSPAVTEMLNWWLPLLFCWYLATVFDQLHEIERALVKTFGLAMLIVGAYGIYQFTAAPPWDTNWMLNIEMTTIGIPEPFGIRVFSTMHSPGVLGFFLAFGMALWVARPVASGMPSTAVAAAALALSQVRSAWLAFAVAALLVVTVLKPSQQLRAAIFVALATIATAAFVLTPEMSELFGSRFSTMEQLEDDESAVARIAGHAAAVEFAVLHPLGAGIGQNDATIESYISMRDSVLVALVVQFGLIGSALYIIALCGLTFTLWRYYRRGASADGRALACVGLGMLSASLLGVVTAGPIGMCLWTVGGLALADRHLARYRLAAVEAQARRLKQTRIWLRAS